MVQDSQTGLPARLLLDDRLKVALAQARRHDHIVAVVVIDLNLTTELRASIGLEPGVELTRMVGEQLLASARKSDAVAHIGSGVFAMALPRVRDLAEVLALTARLVRFFDGTWRVASRSVHLAPAIGVAYYPANGETPDDLLSHAIDAANRAAEAGDRSPYLADPAWQQRARDWIGLDADLRHALGRDELCLFYQPRVNAEDGCAAGWEALLRWRHPDRGLLLPAEFLPVAKQSGLSKRIGSWVIESTCRQLAEWRSGGHPRLRLAVNLSAEQLADDPLLDLVALAIDEHGIRPGELEVEVGERTTLAAQALTTDALVVLKQLGAGLTLDDFGNESCSLRTLADHPFDTVKIDSALYAGSWSLPKAAPSSKGSSPLRTRSA